MTLAAYRKAIAAIVVPIVVYFAMKHGLDLSAEQVAGVTTVISGAVVYAVPNG